MFEPSHFYPPLIKELITELENNEFADSILLSYHAKTITDPILHIIYSSLNYPEIHKIPSKAVIQLIRQEYMSDFPPIDSDSDLHKIRKNSDFLIDCYDDTADLGLDFPGYELEIKSLNSLYSDDTTSTPMKYLSGIKAPKTTPRSRNGLKVLSWKVKEIVDRFGSSTYQEVADCLVKELDESDGDMKDEKNIRRRVYDALNVLIAVGVLKKTSKRVEPLHKPAVNTGDKVKKLKEVTNKFLKLKGLIERNKGMKRGFQNLFLPFDLVVIQKKSERPVRILANLQKTSVKVKLDQKFQFYR